MIRCGEFGGSSRQFIEGDQGGGALSKVTVEVRTLTHVRTMERAAHEMRTARDGLADSRAVGRSETTHAPLLGIKRRGSKESATAYVVASKKVRAVGREDLHEVGDVDGFGGTSSHEHHCGFDKDGVDSVDVVVSNRRLKLGAVETKNTRLNTELECKDGGASTVEGCESVWVQGLAEG